MGKVGLEPTHIAAADFESAASTIPPLAHIHQLYTEDADVANLMSKILSKQQQKPSQTTISTLPCQKTIFQ